jgi:cell division septum initiation protein DivIVA
MEAGRPQFKTALRGYERNQVDSMVDKALSGEPTGLDPKRAFTVVLRGYDRAEVDRFFEQQRR